MVTPVELAFATPVDDVLVHLQSDATAGLSQAEADARLTQFGPNEVSGTPPVEPWRRFLRQFVDPVVYLLLAAIVVSSAVWVAEGASGFPLDAGVIALIVLLNAAVGFLQEGKAADAVAALQDMTRSEATVLRDGIATTIFTTQLIPGDVLLLSEGDIVAADARLFDAAGLRVAEAPLTGESEPVDKTVSPVDQGALLGDRSSMVFSGTTVVSGRGRAVVVATGFDTEMGRIATLLEEAEEEPTPLQTEIQLVGKVLGIAVIAIAVVVVGMLIVIDGVSTAHELLDAMLIGVSLAVAAVPEGLPAVLSVVLALGVQRMSKRNALIKRLVSVEALGSATIICSDKTGTLTRNEMVVRRIVVPSGSVTLTGAGYGANGGIEHDDRSNAADVDGEVRFALLAAALDSDASIDLHEDGVHVVGDPTELALIAALPKVGIGSDDLSSSERVGEVPFSSDRKRMSTAHINAVGSGGLVLFAKGAPDQLLERCESELVSESAHPLSDTRREFWNDAVDELADAALRTLAVAYRRLPLDFQLEDLDERFEEHLTLLGVFGIIDPPRLEAKEAIEAAHSAGIRVAMITGDHPRTAHQIATELGISEPGGSVVTALDIENATDEELEHIVKEASVYARVSPEHKLRIVNALTASGEVVGMTGDGVNDAPALRSANIGVAMGITGTDVSKDAADMILADDNFATIVEAVSEGRAIFHNIRSFLRYLLSSNAGEVLTIFLGVLAAGLIGLDAAGDGLASPLLAVQILWINLITDVAPALALGVDPPLSGLMDRRPRLLSERIIDRRMQIGILLSGLTMALATLFALDLGLPGGLVEGTGDLATARTNAFNVLVLAQLFNTFASRSDTESAFKQVFCNHWLLGAIAISLALQFCVVYIPWLNEAFGTVPLSVSDWIVSIALATSVLWVSEVRKFILRIRTASQELD